MSYYDSNAVYVFSPGDKLDLIRRQKREMGAKRKQKINSISQCHLLQQATVLRLIVAMHFKAGRLHKGISSGFIEKWD